MTEITTPTTQAVEPPAQGTSAPETQTTTAPAAQEPFDADRAMATIKAQREEAKALKAQLKELEVLKAEKAKREEAEMTELQRLQKQAAELQAEREKLTLDILRRDVVAESGLPAVFADRLKGTSKEEMLADAKAILEVLPQAQPKTAPHLPPASPSTGQVNETDAQIRERLFGKQVNIFDKAVLEERGGGVVFHQK